MEESTRASSLFPLPPSLNSDSLFPNTDIQPKAEEADEPPAHTNGKRKKFVIPTPDEVRDYATSNGYQVDAERFWDFYEAKGWKVGNQPMKNWQACVRTWARGSPKAPSTQGDITMEEIFGPDYRSRL